MQFLGVTRPFNKTDNETFELHPIGLNEQTSTNVEEAFSWTVTNKASNILRDYSLFWYDTGSHSLASWLVEKENVDRSLSLPQIFSISEEAVKILLGDEEFRRDIIKMTQYIGQILSEMNITTLGEVSIFQEDTEEPKLFVTYGVTGKKYSKILEIWDEISKKVGSVIPTSTLEKTAIVFEEL